MAAPPPMRLVSRTEQSQLSATNNAKVRMKTAITIAEGHLARAESLTDQKEFDGASAELGGYLGLISDLRNFLSSLDSNKGSTRDLFRHMEMTVRTHLPRLAVLRRSTPIAYATHIKDAEEYIKDTRAAALDSFYGGTVLREPPPNRTPTAEAPTETRDTAKRP